VDVGCRDDGSSFLPRRHSVFSAEDAGVVVGGMKWVLAVNILAMGNSQHENQNLRIVNFIDDPVQTQPDTPKIIIALHFDYARGPRINCQLFKHSNNSSLHLQWQAP